MAVLVEALSVIIKASSINTTFDKLDISFESIIPNDTYCADNELARVGFMIPVDVESFIKLLENYNLVHQEGDKAIDLVVVDQKEGILGQCDWLEYGYIDMIDGGETVAACRLVGSKNMQILTPTDWTFEESLSSSHTFVATEQIDKSLEYLRHEDELDVYYDILSEKEVFVGRTGQY